MAGFYALLGIFQYFTTLPLTNYFSVLPGLTLNQALVSISTRDGLNRPASTAIHAIEFGVVLTALLPAVPPRPAARQGAAPVAPATSRPSQSSRPFRCASLARPSSAVRSRCSRSCPHGLRGRGRADSQPWASGRWPLFVLAPGVLGTLQGLFVNISNDSSAASRTDSYGIAWDFIERHPVTGRGYGTFLPSYRILDNQYLLSMIEIGFLGLVALLLVFLTCARLCGRHPPPLVRSASA